MVAATSRSWSIGLNLSIDRDCLLPTVGCLQPYL
jgi:hypothetical protein